MNIHDALWTPTQAGEENETRFIRAVNITENYVAFWGSIFSNFYKCDIHATNDWWDRPIDLHFSSSEQYFMWEKATYFNDNETAEKILNAETPVDAKRLGREVKNFNDKEWEKVREAAMWNAVWLKFSQNEDLKKVITDPIFAKRHFVEGSPIDKIWGVGLVWTDPKIADEKNWNGLNLFGKTLDKVRLQLVNDTLKNEKNNA